jgi:hypothetical protein
MAKESSHNSNINGTGLISFLHVVSQYNTFPGVQYTFLLHGITSQAQTFQKVTADGL